MRERHAADVETLAVDLVAANGRARLVESARAFGANVLVNNAGVNRFGRFVEHAEADIERLIATNVTAPMLLTREMLRTTRHLSSMSAR